MRGGTPAPRCLLDAPGADELAAGSQATVEAIRTSLDLSETNLLLRIVGTSPPDLARLWSVVEPHVSRVLALAEDLLGRSWSLPSQALPSGAVSPACRETLQTARATSAKLLVLARAWRCSVDRYGSDLPSRPPAEERSPTCGDPKAPLGRPASSIVRALDLGVVPAAVRHATDHPGCAEVLQEIVEHSVSLEAVLGIADQAIACTDRGLGDLDLEMTRVTDPTVVSALHELSDHFIPRVHALVALAGQLSPPRCG